MFQTTQGETDLQQQASLADGRWSMDEILAVTWKKCGVKVKDILSQDTVASKRTDSPQNLT